MNDAAGIQKEMELMQEVKYGNQSAFAELYQLYQGPLVNFFYRLSGTAALAEDCLQEVFYRLWTHRATYEPRAKVSTYIFQIAKNYWINEGKKLKHKPISFTTLGGRNTDKQNHPADFAVDVRQPDPAQTALSNELKEALKAAIARLPEAERLVLVLRQTEELPHAEIAEILDVAEITVKVRLAKTLKRLEKSLQKYLQ